MSVLRGVSCAADLLDRVDHLERLVRAQAARLEQQAEELSKLVSATPTSAAVVQNVTVAPSPEVSPPAKASEPKRRARSLKNPTTKRSGGAAISRGNSSSEAACSSARGLVDWARVLLHRVEGAVFVQIGANVGPGAYDAVFAHAVACRWRGVAVEPVPAYHARLAGNYRAAWARSGAADLDGAAPVLLLQQAVADFNGTNEFAFGLGGRAGEASRLTRNVHGRFAVSAARTVNVSVTTLEPVWRALEAHVGGGSHGASARVDVLVVDAEGEETRILKSPLPHPRPAYVLYEHKHLTPRDRATVSARLHAQGYVLVEPPGRPKVCPIYEVCHVTARGSAHGGDLLYGQREAVRSAGLGAAPDGWRQRELGFY